MANHVTPEQENTREALYNEITRQVNELETTHLNSDQAAAVKDLAAAYAHIAAADWPED